MKLSDFEKISPNIYRHKTDKSKIMFRVVQDKKPRTKTITVNTLLGKRELNHNLQVELTRFRKEVDKPKSEVTLRELYEAVRKAHTSKSYKSKSYTYAYQKYISHLDKKRVADIKKEDITKILEKMRREGKAEQTIKHILNILSPVFKKALENEIIQISPMQTIKIKTKRKPKIVTNATAEWKKIKSTLDDIYKDNPCYKSIFLFALYGRRKQEILKLRWSNIDFENNYYWIVENKVDEPQKFALPEEIKNELLKIKKIDEYIYYNPSTKKPINDVRKQILKIKEILNDPTFTIHKCRNILVSMLAEQGVEAIYLSAILGHKDINTINIYLSQNNHKASKMAIDKIEKLKAV
jgi:integrase